jgi:hypothetical protein
MSSTFETLSDEIIMIIFQYSGDVYTIFRTFLGLNQRLNNILIDKRLHLFADLLYINASNAILIDYYKSNVFENVCYKLSSMHSPINEQELHQCFESLVYFHIKERFKRLGEEVQSNLATFQTIRQQLSDSEIIDIDNQLRNLFFDLKTNDLTIESIKQIESLVLTKAARLECDNHEISQFNIAKALNELLLHYLNKTYSSNQSLTNCLFYMLNYSKIRSSSLSLINPITQMLKTLIISNTRLLNNRDNTDTGESSSLWFFLFYSIYQLRYCYYAPPEIYVNMECYDAVIDLLLFSIQCQKQANNDENWARESLFNILKMFSIKRVTYGNKVFIQNVRWAILEIIIDENVLTSTVTWQENEDNAFRLILDDLIKDGQLAVVFILYHRLQNVQSYFNKPNNIRRNVNMLTGSPERRELFKIFMDVKPVKSWIVSKDLLFLLLQKKERILLKKLFTSSSFLINQVDEDGNDPLLYICLKVRGCRHRIIKLLITMGCDLQRKNLNGENFFDAIQLERNQSLLKDLLKNQTIKIDDQSGEIQPNL